MSDKLVKGNEAECLGALHSFEVHGKPNLTREDLDSLTKVYPRLKYGEHFGRIRFSSPEVIRSLEAAMVIIQEDRVVVAPYKTVNGVPVFVGFIRVGMQLPNGGIIYPCNWEVKLRDLGFPERIIERLQWLGRESWKKDEE